jgi:hypothetical protein
VISKRRRSSPEKGPFSGGPPPTSLEGEEEKEEDEDEEEEERGNTPVKEKPPVEPSKRSNWKERVIRKSDPSTAIDLTEGEELPLSPAPQVASPPTRSTRGKSRSQSAAPPSPVSAVFTVKRCAAYERYLGHRVVVSIPGPPSSDGKQRKASRPRASGVTVSIGALEECDHVFEHDEFLSGRSPASSARSPTPTLIPSPTTPAGSGTHKSKSSDWMARVARAASFTSRI